MAETSFFLDKKSEEQHIDSYGSVSTLENVNSVYFTFSLFLSCLALLLCSCNISLATL